MIRNAHHHGPRAIGGFQPLYYHALPGRAQNFVPGTHGVVPPPVIGGVASASHDVAADVARFNLQSDLDRFNAQTDVELDQRMSEYFADDPWTTSGQDPFAIPSAAAPAASSAAASGAPRPPQIVPPHLVPPPPQET